MPINSLDSIDCRILGALQRNSRLSNADLAKAVGLSPSPCLRRVRRLEKRGYIRGYRAMLDRTAVGLGVTAFARLQVEWPRAKTLRDEIRKLPQIVACYVLTGESGVLLEIVAADLEEYSNFLFGTLYNVSGVRGIQSSVLLEVVKERETTPLPIDDGADHSRRQRATSQKTLSIEPVGPRSRSVNASSSRR
ncbi:MAG TPA: Lrp/AsnC family transcriptional regulator [Candidatus Dormibacteraeota bacterium]|nr:Lrp/AsnC family transcriptional regulator [Candidatus Dormibacteraeota bacterium]